LDGEGLEDGLVGVVGEGKGRGQTFRKLAPVTVATRAMHRALEKGRPEEEASSTSRTGGSGTAPLLSESGSWTELTLFSFGSLPAGVDIGYEVSSTTYSTAPESCHKKILKLRRRAFVPFMFYILGKFLPAGKAPRNRQT
jgi:hypothetical protein